MRTTNRRTPPIIYMALSMWWSDEWKNPLQRQHQDSNGNSHNGMTSVCWELLIKSEVASMYRRAHTHTHTAADREIEGKRENAEPDWIRSVFRLYIHPSDVMKPPPRLSHTQSLSFGEMNASHSHSHLATNREDQQKLSVTISTYQSNSTFYTICCHYQYLNYCCRWTISLHHF